jgi:signal transduction histidine kinase
MGTHGAASVRPRPLPPGNRAIESTSSVNSAVRRPLLKLSNWPVSRRLFAVIVAALLMGVIFGGLRVADAESSAAQFSRTSQFANLGDQLVVLVNDLQNERDETLSDLAQDSTPPPPLQALFATTDAEVAVVQQAAVPIGGGFPANIQANVTTVLDDISPSRLNQLHNTINVTLPANELAAIANYGVVIGDIINLADQVSQGVSDASLASAVRALNALSLAKEQVSQQRALINDAFYNPNDLGNTTTALPIAESEEASDEAAFQQSATPAEQAILTDGLGAPGVPLQLSMAQNIESNIVEANGTVTGTQTTPTVLEDLQALQGDLSTAQTAATLPAAPKGQKAGPIGVRPTGTAPTTIKQGSAAWDLGMGDQLDAMQATESQIAGNIVARADQLHSSAQQTALLFGIITALVLLIVLFAALVVARSLVLPLRRLRAGALNIASVQLPERVRLLSESPDAAATMEVAPINVVSDDEIGQVARAFDQVHAEAVRLAGEQALLRSSFNAMFVNLSRRSQSLIERLARTIDTLEQSEDDPDRLGSLFTMDHMVTRMRRNSENLLLLAGHENPRKWSESIPLADVARAATSEIEQYNRVTLNVPPGIAVIGPAVSDVVHLIAELLENATIFSPKDTEVHLSMQELSSGGVLIEVLDKGIGVSDVRLTDMNFRLDNPPTIDVSVSRHMGLFAVARLAERHRVRVRLRPATPQGLSALVWLPEGVIERAR